MVFDKRGYLHLTDFGIAFENTTGCMDNNDLRSGTPGYMAPEIMQGMNHSFPADYFALGVMAFECVTGKRPYRGKTPEQIREKMLEENPV